MKNAAILLSFLLIFGLSAVCWYVLLVDPAVVPALAAGLPGIYASIWGKIFLAAFGLLTLCCSLTLVAIFLGIESVEKRQVVFENESGSVGVSLSAIEEFIKRKGKTVSGVRDLTVRANAAEGRLSLQTKLVLDLQKNVPEFTQAFQQRLMFELENTLGLKNVKEVKVLISKIYPKDSPPEPIYLGNPTQLLLTEPDANSKNEEEEKAPDEDKQVVFLDSEVEPYTVVTKNRSDREEDR